jgi:hypothetical protein
VGGPEEQRRAQSPARPLPFSSLSLRQPAKPYAAWEESGLIATGSRWLIAQMFASLGSSRARLLLSSCSWVLRRPSLSPLSLLFSSSTRRPNPIALVVPSSQSFEAKELGAKQDRITGKWAVDSDVFEREGRESFDKWLLLPKAGEPTNHPPPNGDEGTIVFFDIETTGLPAKGLKFGSFWDFKELSKYESCVA